MSSERPSAQQRSDKSPPRAKLELRRHHKLLRRTHSARGTSAPARLSASPDVDERRSLSPRRAPSRRSLCLINASSHDSRLPRAKQRRRIERRCLSEVHASQSCPTSPMRATSALIDADGALWHLCRIIVSLDDDDGERRAKAFADANLDPPITRLSLSELDISSINTNSKLRHDVNFDRELHFRPNLDGAKGRAKRQAQADYWLALVAELELYTAVLADPSLLTHQTVSSDVVRRACSRRIPIMFEAVKAILKALVPEPDHASIDQHLDVPMIMQEVQAGVCDLPRIARWLAHTLKAHCAPMRDHIIDNMVKYIDRGVAENKMKYLVEGLIQLFGAMEAMKLDVANHQIRQMRPMLIEDTINFEQQYHLDRIARSRVDVVRARSWYHAPAWRTEQHQEPGIETDHLSRSHSTQFLVALLDTLLSPACSPFPDTFKLDAERLRSIRSDIYDLFCLDACESVFLQLAGRRHFSPTQKEYFRFVISTIVNQSPYGSSWEENIENVAAETVRHLSGVIETDDATASTQESQLRERAEQLLRQIFSDPSRSFFISKAEEAGRQLLPVIQSDIDRFQRSSLVEVFNYFLSSSKALPRQKRRSAQTHDADSVLTDVGRRISHIAILHWRIWRPIVYLNGPEPTVLPNRQPVTATMSRSSTLRDSPAPPQFLASNTPDKNHADGAPLPTEAHVEVAAPDVAEQTPRTIATTDAQPPVDEDPSSPILYRQRTN